MNTTMRLRVGRAPSPVQASLPEPIGPVAPHAPVLLDLYSRIEAMRVADRPAVLQFLSATQGGGATTIARGLARIAAEHGAAALLLDCGGGLAPAADAMSLLDAFKAGIRLDQAALPGHAQGLSEASLSHLPHPLLDLPASEFRDFFDRLRQSFATTLLDCPAPALAADSIALSRYCDGTVLVVHAEIATMREVQTVRDDIERAGGQVIGAVLNRRRQRVPSWLARLF